jgi:sugar phosphate isomerase/epimerase
MLEVGLEVSVFQPPSSNLQSSTLKKNQLKNRRTFIKWSAAMASGLLLPLGACNTSANKQEAAGSAAPEEGVKLTDYGIQLWTVKEAMLENPQEVLRQLASYGYTQIESFEGDKGIFWGMSNKAFRDFIEEQGMKLVGSHANVKEQLEEKAAQAAEIGMPYLIDPYEGPQENLEGYRRMAERFNEYGKICQKHGVKFAYHNHDYTFQEVEGRIPHKILLEETDPELVDFEMDIYWVITAGADPEEYLRNYPGRFKLSHIKDRMQGAVEPFASTQLGTGIINYPGILETAKANGMEYFIAEQERFDNSTPLGSSQKNAEYLKNLRVGA